MACLNLSNGNVTSLTWGTNASTNTGDVTITRSVSQITVQKTSIAGSLVLNGDFRYVVFGADNFVALLRIESSLTRTVSIVDITGASLTLTQILQINVPSSQALPNISQSPVNGRAAFFWTGTGTPNEATSLQIVRSDDGSPLLSGFGTVTGLNGTISAEVTATQLIIHHPNTNNNDSTTGTRPAGSLTIVPGSQNFGEAVLGASDPSLATITRTFTFRNDGNDCLTINAVANNAPFTVTAASAAQFGNPIEPGQDIDIDVVFAPTTTGNVTRQLQVTRTPGNGASSFSCSGSARQAVANIATSVGAINFGTLPHPGTDTEIFNVSNTGDLNLAISIAAAPAASNFTWAPVTGQALPVGGAPIPVTVTFATPGDVAAIQRILTVTATMGAASRMVTLNGAGCVANSVILAPPVSPLAYGQLERGFRTVRFVEFANDGDGDLTFRARITPGANPAHAAFFGLVVPDSDITDAPATRQYAVLPDHRCGPGPVGLNTVPVAVSFFAEDVPGAYSANLVVDLHNASNVPATTTWTFALTAEVINPIPIDAVLVLDHSGSMGANVGSRNKMEAAVSGGRLLIQMLRETAPDRAAIVKFNTAPTLVQAILPIQGNRALFENQMGSGNFIPGGWTNIAGGVIAGNNEFATAHPASPPILKKAMIVLTDGIENRCFQQGGTGPWFSITGRDGNGNASVMARPDDTPQDTDPLPTPAGIRLYGIGLGQPNQVDGAALDALSTATGASYEGVVDLTGKDYFLLEKYFTQIFMETAGLQQISDPFFTINPGDSHEHEFDIFPGDVNAMVVLYDHPGKRLPFFIVSPKGEVLSGTSLPAGFSLRFHSTPTARFAEFYFPHKEPDRYAGRWKVIVRHEKRVCGDERNKGEEKEDVGPGFTPRKCREYDQPVDYGIAIGAGSNLRMQPYVEPGDKYVGDTLRLTAVVSEAGLPVKNSHVKVTVTNPIGQVFNVVLRDDGQSQDGGADDGEYARVFTQTTMAGVYSLKFRAEGQQAGRPYEREAARSKTIYDKRRPPGGGDTSDDGKPGGGGSPGGRDCCRELLRALRRQEALLKRIAKEVRD